MSEIVDDIFDAAFGEWGDRRRPIRAPVPRGPVGQSSGDPGSAIVAQTVRQLELDLGRAMLVIQTLLRFGQEKGMFTKQEFLAKLQAIDLEDGRMDGKLTRSRAPLVCSGCGKTNNHAATSCMYCGGPLAPQSPL